MIAQYTKFALDPRLDPVFIIWFYITWNNGEEKISSSNEMRNLQPALDQDYGLGQVFIQSIFQF